MHRPSCGQQPLQCGSCDDGPSHSRQASSALQCHVRADSDCGEEGQLDCDAHAQAIEGPEVGVPQFGQGPEGHRGKQDLRGGGGVCKSVAEKEPCDPLCLNHERRSEWNGHQSDEVHGAKRHVPHLFVVALDARQSTEQHAVSQFSQDSDGLSHEVHSSVVQACLARAEFFAHEVHVDFGRRISQQIERGAAHPVSEQLTNTGQFEPLKNRDSGEPQIAQTEHGVLNEQGTHIGPYAGAIVRHGQSHAKIAHHHARECTCCQGFEIHFPDEQASRHHTESRNDKAQGDPAQHGTQNGFAIVVANLRCGNEHAAKEQQAERGTEPPRR